MDSLQWPMTVTVTPDSIMRGEFAVTLYVSIRADPNEETASATDLKDNLLTRIPRNQPRQAWWEPLCCWHRADSRVVPSQWETSLQSNTVSHWLGAKPKISPVARTSEPGYAGHWVTALTSQTCCLTPAGSHDDAPRQKGPQKKQDQLIITKGRPLL